MHLYLGLDSWATTLTQKKQSAKKETDTNTFHDVRISEMPVHLARVHRRKWIQQNRRAGLSPSSSSWAGPAAPWYLRSARNVVVALGALSCGPIRRGAARQKAVAADPRTGRCPSPTPLARPRTLAPPPALRRAPARLPPPPAVRSSIRWLRLRASSDLANRNHHQDGC